jgi:hypothetical protein
MLPPIEMLHRIKYGALVVIPTSLNHILLNVVPVVHFQVKPLQQVLNLHTAYFQII